MLTQTKVYLYNGEGELAETALYNGEVSAANEQQRYRYEYDSLGRVICSQEITNGALRQGTETLYDDANRVKKQSWSLFQTEDGKTTTKTYTGRYTYNTGNGTMATADFGTGRTATFAYDNLQRLTSETMAGLYTKSYTYRDISTTRTTTQIASESYTGLCSGWSNRGASYTYDAMGNITSITGRYKTTDDIQRTYTYDAQNQLLSETIGSDTTSYTYDTAGNIRSITGPSVSKSFSYNDSGDWKDLLTSVTVNGTTRNITYEEENGVTIGNPLSYFNGTQYTLAWQNGRQLQSLSGGGKSATYTYGADGIRTSKTVTDSSGTTTYQYTTQNGQIARQSWSAGGTAYQMDFIYDAAGRPLAMYYRSKAAGQTDFNGDSYYYETNQQGDVTGLYKITYNATTKSLTATRVASYEYDAWGNVTYSTGEMADINPLRYRGYYQDWESGYYYLQSRYYDPVIGRFVNADGYASTGEGFLGYNMFAYCNNDPVNATDSTGEMRVFGAGGGFGYAAGGGSFYSGGSTVSQGIQSLTEGLAISTYLALNAVNAYNDLREDVIAMHHYSAREESRPATIEGANTRERDHHQEYFPVNPYEFVPRGLVRKEYPGSYNGRIIKWVYPLQNTPIFEWNEDFENGAHYHVLKIEWAGKHDGTHYMPGTPVPEPWNSIYFGDYG